PVLNKSAKFYSLSEDLDTRGLKSANIDSKIQIINYSELVDLIFNDYEKLAWL
ncbi:MAG: hypothetical protein HY758_00500, partial [Nitrospirae bacterium]|nr:hypothetical protein [Nitrospirota bacterium]